jgi:hypothetical protein
MIYNQSKIPVFAERFRQSVAALQKGITTQELCEHLATEEATLNIFHSVMFLGTGKKRLSRQQTLWSIVFPKLQCSNSSSGVWNLHPGCKSSRQNWGMALTIHEARIPDSLVQAEWWCWKQCLGSQVLDESKTCSETMISLSFETHPYFWI